MTPFAAILPAAGSATRFGRNKLLEPLGDESVLARSIGSLWNHEFCETIFVATSTPTVIAHVRTLPDDWQKDVRLCPGGPTRAHSVLSALRDVPEQYEWVAIHDAARPFVSTDLIDRTFAAAREHGAAVPALPVTQTIKQATGPLPARAERTIPRSQLWAMQTPQIMRRTDLLDAFERGPIPLEEVTDDAQLLELAGREVWLVPGDERNIKITTPMDMVVARMIVSGDE